MSSLRLLLLVALCLGAWTAPAAAQSAADPVVSGATAGESAEGSATQAPEAGQQAPADEAPTTTEDAAVPAPQPSAEMSTTDVRDDDVADGTDPGTDVTATEADDEGPVVVVDDGFTDPGTDCAQTDTCGTGHHGTPVEEETETVVAPPGPAPADEGVTAVGGVVIERPGGTAGAARPGRAARVVTEKARKRTAGVSTVIGQADPANVVRTTSSARGALASTGLSPALALAAIAALALGWAIVRAARTAPLPRPATWSLPAQR